MRINDVQDGFRYSILLVFDYLPDLVRFNTIFLIENISTGEKNMVQESVDCNPIKKSDMMSHLKAVGFVDVDIIENERTVSCIAKK